MQTLRWEEIAALLEQYQQLRATLGDTAAQDHPALVALEEEWRRRAPRSNPLAQVADISGKSPNPRGYWYSLMRQNAYTRHGYPFQ
jgi:hypothetical protein